MFKIFNIRKYIQSIFTNLNFHIRKHTERPDQSNFNIDSIIPLGNKAFSMLELLTVVSIILIITSIATVSYGRYKKSSQKQLILSNLDMIHTGFTTCMKVRPFGKCDTLAEIKLKEPLDATIQPKSQGTKLCFLMTFGGFKGCVDNSGNQTSKTELDSSAPSTACSNTGVCTP